MLRKAKAIFAHVPALLHLTMLELFDTFRNPKSVADVLSHILMRKEGALCFVIRAMNHLARESRLSLKESCEPKDPTPMLLEPLHADQFAHQSIQLANDPPVDLTPNGTPIGGLGECQPFSSRLLLTSCQRSLQCSKQVHGTRLSGRYCRNLFASKLLSHCHLNTLTE